MTTQEKAKQPSAAKKVFVRTQSGKMIHLFTNVEFTTDPKRVDLDSFVQAQLDAGKLVIAED